MTTTIPLILAPDAPAELVALFSKTLSLAGTMARQSIPTEQHYDWADAARCAASNLPAEVTIPGGNPWVALAAHSLSMLVRHAAIGSTQHETYEVKRRGVELRAYVNTFPNYARTTIEGGMHGGDVNAEGAEFLDLLAVLEGAASAGKFRAERRGPMLLLVDGRDEIDVPESMAKALAKRLRAKALPRVQRWLAATGIAATTT